MHPDADLLHALLIALGAEHVVDGEAGTHITQQLNIIQGKKMGKTAGNAVWLDPNKTSPFEFYQYWRNVGDADVMKCIRMLTFSMRCS